MEGKGTRIVSIRTYIKQFIIHLSLHLEVGKCKVWCNQIEYLRDPKTADYWREADFRTADLYNDFKLNYRFNI